MSNQPHGSPNPQSSGSPYTAPHRRGQFGQPGPTPDHGSANPEQNQSNPGQSVPGQPVPGQPVPGQWGSASAAPQSEGDPYGARYGEGNPYGAPYGSSAPAAPSPYTAAPMTTPPKRKGKKRMIFGSLGIIAGLIGAAIFGFLGFAVGSASSITNITTAPGDSVTFPADAVVYYVLTPEEAGVVQCEATGPGALQAMEGDTTSALPIGDQSWYLTSVVSTSGDGAEVTVSCDGVNEVAYSALSFGDLFQAALVGAALPLILSAISLALLIWGIVAFVKSKTKQTA